VRKRAGDDFNHDNDSADNGQPADNYAGYHDYALLIPPHQRGKRAREQRALLRLFRLFVRRLGGLGFFFGLADDWGDSLKFFAASQIH